MGNIISSFTSGFSQVIGNIFRSPLDFLAGKSCNSVCDSTWDFVCFIENFCIANLLKMAMVLGLLYIVLLFFYLLYKIGICQCIGRSLCKMLWTCIASWFSVWEYCCTFLCVKAMKLKRQKRIHMGDFEEFMSNSSNGSSEEYCNDESFSCHVSTPMEEVSRSSPSRRRRRGFRERHVRRSLRPRSHRVQVGIVENSVHGDRRNHGRGRHVSTIHDIRVTKTSKFVHKGKGGTHRSRRW